MVGDSQAECGCGTMLIILLRSLWKWLIGLFKKEKADRPSPVRSVKIEIKE